MANYEYSRYSANSVYGSYRIVSTQNDLRFPQPFALRTLTSTFTYYPSYTFSANDGYKGAGTPLTRGAGQSPPAGYYYVIDSLNLIKNQTFTDNGNLYQLVDRTNTTRDTTYVRGNLLGTLNAPEGTYPENGRHTDGYWYVRGSILNSIPTLSLTTANNRTLYENDPFSIIGQVTDTDVGDVVNVRYAINQGNSTAILASISTGRSVQYSRLLTFKQGRLFHDDIAVTGILDPNVQHTLRVWAEDDKGGRTPDMVRYFQVVSNRPAVLNIDPIASSSNLIPSDFITLSGNVLDPEGGAVDVSYQIGSGARKSIYNGLSGAFSAPIPLSEFNVGANSLVVQATDSFNVRTTKTFRFTKTLNSTPLLKSVATYKLTPPNTSAKGIIMWVQRQVGDLAVTAEVSFSSPGEPENFVPMTNTVTAPISSTISEHEFTYNNNNVSAENIVVRLTMTRTSATSTAAIKQISGVLS